MAVDGVRVARRQHATAGSSSQHGRLTVTAALAACQCVVATQSPRVLPVGRVGVCAGGGGLMGCGVGGSLRLGWRGWRALVAARHG